MARACVRRRRALARRFARRRRWRRPPRAGPAPPPGRKTAATAAIGSSTTACARANVSARPSAAATAYPVARRAAAGVRSLSAVPVDATATRIASTRLRSGGSPGLHTDGVARRTACRRTPRRRGSSRPGWITGAASSSSTSPVQRRRLTVNRVTTCARAVVGTRIRAPSASRSRRGSGWPRGRHAETVASRVTSRKGPGPGMDTRLASRVQR